ncbi:MAG TPA: flagellar motor protein MotB [Acidimicrobiales bacterium]|nr:flagellar motor protein MotB [Acidimicrobiales bacterium]
MKSSMRLFQARSHNEESEEGEAGAGMERWLLTYADMITLLLVLFIVLYALSSLNHVKYAEFQHSLAKSMTQGSSTPKSPPAATSKAKAKARARASASSKPVASLASVQRALQAALARAGLLHDVTLQMTAQGLVEGFVSGKLFYGVDVAQLTPTGNRAVDVTSSVLKHYSNPVDVDGYADNQPIVGGPYANNWALSSARADNVVTRLTTVDGDAPSQFLALGFGQYHPIVPNSNVTNQAANRRVNIVIMTKRPRGE